jgi:hypothetical protein
MVFQSWSGVVSIAERSDSPGLSTPRHHPIHGAMLPSRWTSLSISSAATWNPSLRRSSAPS